MIKVLIVDDEMLVRVGIKSTIEWETHGFTVVGEACNGEDALEKIHNCHPDLVLTDIRMPKMDGLQLLKEIRRQELPVEIIIMSCYNEFELVRTALQNGASDYLLKLSLSPEELLEVLERVKKKIRNRKNISDSAGLFSKNDVYDKFVRTLWEPDAGFPQLDRLAQAAGLTLSLEHASLLLLALDAPFDPKSLGCPEADSQTLSMAHNLLRDYLIHQKLGDIVTLQREQCHFLIVLSPDADAPGTAQNIRKKLKDYLQKDCSIALLPRELYETEHLTRFLQRWEEFMDLRFLAGRGGCFTFSEKKDSAPSSHTLSAKSFISHIHGSADFQDLPPAIDHMTRHMSLQGVSRIGCLQLFLSVFYQITALLSIYGGSEGGLHEFCGQSLVESLRRLQFLSDARPWFDAFTALALAYLAENGKNQKSDDILAVIDYAQTNLHLPISLQDAASHIGISSSYLSTLFKRETGQSFTEFLTRLRMERAKEFLEDRSIYIYEICERVGYTDPNYFCKVFKKYTGMSPEAYRRSRQ